VPTRRGRRRRRARMVRNTRAYAVACYTPRKYREKRHIIIIIITRARIFFYDITKRFPHYGVALQQVIWHINGERVRAVGTRKYFDKKI